MALFDLIDHLTDFSHCPKTGNEAELTDTTQLTQSSIKNAYYPGQVYYYIVINVSPLFYYRFHIICYWYNAGHH